MLGVILQDVIILGQLAILVQQWPVEGVIDLQNWKVFEILLHAIDRQDLFDKGFSCDDMGPPNYAALIAVLRVNLPNPAGIAITGCTNEDLGMEISKIKASWVGIRDGRHGLILDENEDSTKLVNGRFRDSDHIRDFSWSDDKGGVWQDINPIIWAHFKTREVVV
jgi:hypothetical protein